MTRPPGRIRSGLAWLSIAVLLFGALCVNALGDRVWWALPILFGPRWIWTGCLVGVLPLLFTMPRRGFPLAVLAIAILAIGILDFRIGAGRLLASSATIVRVMELNADGNAANASGVAALIDKEKPDLIMIAECGSKVSDAIRKIGKYDVRAERSLCFASLAPIESWRVDTVTVPWKVGVPGIYARATIFNENGPIQIGVVHLATPRHALDSYFDLSGIPTLGPLTRANSQSRSDESMRARRWITTADSLPTIIAGDFNTPVASAIYQRDWGDLSNSLSSTGVGLLYTKRTTWWGIRIDHILGGHGVHAIAAWVGPNLGSDHLPIFADLSLPK